MQQSDFTAGAATALSDMLDKAAVVDEASEKKEQLDGYSR